MRALWAVVLWLTIASPALAQRPTRGDFEAAVLARAALEVPEHPCDGGEPATRDVVPARPLSREERALVIGRALRAPDGRWVAFVRIATGESDANEDLEYAYVVVVLAQNAGAWSAVTIDIDVEGASFEYEDPTLLVARLEDVDGDGSVELFAVLDTNTETVCGPGFCDVRRTVVVELAGAGSVAANITSRTVCQIDSVDRDEGTVVLRDTNGDGHRDLVLRVRHCPATEYNDDGTELGRAPCVRQQTVFLWENDRYRAPPSPE